MVCPSYSLGLHALIAANMQADEPITEGESQFTGAPPGDNQRINVFLQD